MQHDKITTTFDFNIQGWMTKINDTDGSDYFAMELTYEGVEGGESSKLDDERRLTI